MIWAGTSSVVQQNTALGLRCCRYQLLAGVCQRTPESFAAQLRLDASPSRRVPHLS